MNILNSLLRYLRHGFTLVELMAVIAIMAILAAIEATGVVHLVPAYGRRSCEEERIQAARAFVSNWLETRNLAAVKYMNSLQQPNIFILLPLLSPLEHTPNLHLRPVFRHSPSGH